MAVVEQFHLVCMSLLGYYVYESKFTMRCMNGLYNSFMPFCCFISTENTLSLTSTCHLFCLYLRTCTYIAVSIIPCFKLNCIHVHF